MGKPFRSGQTPQGAPLWSARTRTANQDMFVSGQSTAKAAREELQRQVQELRALGQPMFLGPEKTTVAKALQMYSMERLAYMKGAHQLARDINRYLRAAGLETLVVKELPASDDDMARQQREVRMKLKRSICVGDQFVVSLEPAHTPRVTPNGLHAHRKLLLSKTADSARHRDVLATTMMADVTSHQVQALFNAMRTDGCAAATVVKERSLLSPLFKYARRMWHWASPARNPVSDLKMPKVNNARERVMSADEEKLLHEAMADARNALLEPTTRLLTQTAMRVGEPIYEATWGDVDWERCVLTLRDAKAGGRKVPLSPEAISALHDIRALVSGEPDERIIGMTYEALKAAWNRACKRAGVENLRLHDLRHTAATRMALKTGNVFLVKALTGHKTLCMVERYVNVTAADVVAVLHQQPANSLYAGVASPSLTEPTSPVSASAEAAPVQSAPIAGTMLTAEALQAVMASAMQAALAQLQPAAGGVAVATASSAPSGAPVSSTGAVETRLSNNVVDFRRREA